MRHILTTVISASLNALPTLLANMIELWKKKKSTVIPNNQEKLSLKERLMNVKDFLEAELFIKPVYNIPCL